MLLVIETIEHLCNDLPPLIEQLKYQHSGHSLCLHLSLRAYPRELKDFVLIYSVKVAKITYHL